MNLSFRLISAMIACLVGPKELSPGEYSILRFRVLPQDCAIRAMTNERYHRLMDIGRFDLFIRTGCAEGFLRRHLIAHVRHVHVRFKRPLKLFQRFELRSRIVTVGKYHLVLEQSFYSRGREFAVATCQIMMKQAGKVALIAKAFPLLTSSDKCAGGGH